MKAKTTTLLKQFTLFTTRTSQELLQTVKTFPLALARPTISVTTANTLIHAMTIIASIST